MSAQHLKYYVEGQSFDAELFVPSSPGLRPGVLVCHEGAGLGTHTRAMAKRIADLGFIALAPDLYGEPLKDGAAAVAMIQGLVRDTKRFRERLGAALSCLGAASNVAPGCLAAVGFCFGGTAALELARHGADLACVASIHGGLKTYAKAESGIIKASVLVCTGALDPFVNAAERACFEAEMIAAGADWQMLVLGGAMHGFTNSERAVTAGVGFDARADRRSWEALAALLNEHVSYPAAR